MKSKEWLFLGVSTFITISLVFGFVIFTGNNKTSNPQVKGAQSDSMADHHQPQAADSEVFDSLKGKAAPNFNLTTYDGKNITLNSYKGKKVVLFFSEGLMCYPACWNQIAALGKDSALNSQDTVVLNIVADDKNEWKQAVSKMPELAAATVLFDTNKSVSTTYGVLNLPSSMHKGQYPGHTFVVIDKDGIVRYTFDDTQMGVRNKDIAEQLEKI